MCEKYIFILAFWLLGVLIIFYYNFSIYFTLRLDREFLEWFYFFIAMNMFISFQIIFSSLMMPLILISIIYPKFFDKILLFFEIGDDL